jgi:recombinational DNA repair protein RecT
MAKKTVIKRLLKRAPMSVELAKAVELDHKAATGEGDVLDIEGIEVPNDRADEAEKSALELDGGRK